MKSIRRLLLSDILMLAAIAGCYDQAKKTEPSIDVSTPAVEAGELRVSADAQAAIGLSIVSALERDVRVSIPATGWLAVRPAGEVVVKAPATGFLVPSAAADVWLGRSVSKDDRLADLQVFLSPQEQAQLVAAKEQADTLILQSRATLKLAEQQLQRVQEGGPTAIPGTRLLELREVVARSQAAEQEARDELPFLPEEPYGEELHLKAVPVAAPLAGRIVSTHIAPRQLVIQGDPLWTISDWSRLWIRVPVYAADLSRIVPDEPMDAVVFGGNEVHRAHPVKIPQATEPGKQTVELLYEIENDAGGLRPGQAVSVSLPSAGQTKEIVIPRTAILWDGMGNSWVYARTSPTSFRRKRIELGPLLGKDAVVRRGLGEGDEIVTTGAEALYGEEFKGQIRIEAGEGGKD